MTQVQLIAWNPGAEAIYIPCARFPVVSSIERIEVGTNSNVPNALIYPIAFGRTRPPLLAELAVLTQRS